MPGYSAQGKSEVDPLSGTRHSPPPDPAGMGYPDDGKPASDRFSIRRFHPQIHDPTRYREEYIRCDPGRFVAHSVCCKKKPNLAICRGDAFSGEDDLYVSRSGFPAVDRPRRKTTAVIDSLHSSLSLVPFIFPRYALHFAGRVHLWDFFCTFITSQLFHKQGDGSRTRS